MKVPELVIPAGNPSKLHAALAYGADAVYVGAAGFSMRPDEASFGIEALREAVDIAHTYGRSIYVALNSLLFDEDLVEVRRWIDETASLDFDAIIISDPGLLMMLREMRPELPVHISTQASTSNTRAASFWKAAGARRVILARECSLEQAARVARDSGVDVEIFIHGAMCVAVSGRCLLSAHLCGHSGSRGDCKHSCRWEWQLVEEKRPGEALAAFETGRETIFLGSTDLCLLEHFPDVIQTGVSALKVEGRMKGEYYVAAVTRVYRDALDRYAENPDGFQVDPAWMEELQAVSHRPYATGFAFGYDPARANELQTGRRPLSTYEPLGYVTGENEQTYNVETKNPFSAGEEVEWIGPKMTGGRVVVTCIQDENGNNRERSHCGTLVAVTLESNTRLPRWTMLRRRI